ncbi:unnamed protein product [Parnassius apollo]|uniref:(apollo) hypothetical protein n=1 Tax=Parnassius apollo TaxID=110799 RepID=A0A8S3XIN0_PARAO|nr:unnamed protein product [Parnassius apollo]
MLIDRDKDTSEYWRETEILSLVRNDEAGIDYEKCEQNSPEITLLHLPSRRSVRPVCRTPYEMDQSCVEDEYSFDTEEFLPVTTIDFRAGCNPYWGHPKQEVKALRCDQVLRRYVAVSATISQRTKIVRSPAAVMNARDWCRNTSARLVPSFQIITTAIAAENVALINVSSPTFSFRFIAI